MKATIFVDEEWKCVGWDGRIGRSLHCHPRACAEDDRQQGDVTGCQSVLSVMAGAGKV